MMIFLIRQMSLFSPPFLFTPRLLTPPTMCTVLDAASVSAISVASVIFGIAFGFTAVFATVKAVAYCGCVRSGTSSEQRGHDRQNCVVLTGRVPANPSLGGCINPGYTISAEHAGKQVAFTVHTVERPTEKNVLFVARTLYYDCRPETRNKDTEYFRALLLSDRDDGRELATGTGCVDLVIDEKTGLTEAQLADFGGKFDSILIRGDEIQGTLTDTICMLSALLVPNHGIIVVVSDDRRYIRVIRPVPAGSGTGVPDAPGDAGVPGDAGIVAAEGAVQDSADDGGIGAAGPVVVNA